MRCNLIKIVVFSIKVQSDSVMTDRYIPDDDFDNSEFNETDIGLEYTHNGIPTPKPTMAS